MLDKAKAISLDLEKDLDSLNMMMYSADISHNLMLDLLDLAQMENSTFKLNYNYFSMLEAIKRVFGQVQHIADKKNVQLVLKNVAPN